jgi:hypothetical protein
MRNLMVMMKAVKKFKNLLEKKRPEPIGQYDLVMSKSLSTSEAYLCNTDMRLS